MVVRLAAARGGEAVALVEGAGREVGFAECEIHVGDCGAAEVVESGEKEGRSDAFAAKIGANGNIQDFGFVGDVASGEEAKRMAICFAHTKNAAGRLG